MKKRFLQEILSVPDEKAFLQERLSVPDEKAFLQERLLSVADEKAFLCLDPKDFYKHVFVLTNEHTVRRQKNGDFMECFHQFQALYSLRLYHPEVRNTQIVFQGKNR